MPLPAGVRLDDVASAFVDRALTYVETQTYDVELPPLEGRKYVPVDNSVPAGAKSTSYRQYTRTGVARLITERGQDLPTVALYVKEFYHQFYRIGVSYEYTLDDLLAAQMQSQNGGPAINIDLEESIGARQAIEQKLDSVARIGSADGLSPNVGLLGLGNQPNATIYTVANGATGHTQWATKTPDEVIADLTGIVAAQVASTYKIATPDTAILPILQYETIAGRSMGDNRSDSILSYFLKISTHIRTIDSWAWLQGMGTGGTDRMIVYKRDPRFVRHMISQEFTQMPPQYRNFVFTTECTAKTAGVICPYPFAISYGDGI